MARPTYVVGHTQPGTDAICSAIAGARLEQAQGTDAVPARTGPLNLETEFVLGRWDVNPHRLLEDATEEWLFLVDHTEYSQAVTGGREATIVRIVDHHRLGDVMTGDPISVRTESMGSTATILTRLFESAELAIDTKTAGLLLSGVLSDTVVCRSPTTTAVDSRVVDTLASIGDIDPEVYGRTLLEQKSELGTKPLRDLVRGDYKEYEFGAGTVWIGQVETVDAGSVLDRCEAILDAMASIREDHTLDALMLLVTDLFAEDSSALVVGDHDATIETALETTITDSVADLPGVLSRKKQVVPPLEAAFD